MYSKQRKLFRCVHDEIVVKLLRLRVMRRIARLTLSEDHGTPWTR